MEKNKVLIVDDEPKICSILSALLTKNNYEVQVANSGEVGVDMYGKFLPVVILLDLKMPGMDGMEVMEVLTKQFEAKFADLVIKRLGLEGLKRNAQICLANTTSRKPQH